MVAMLALLSELRTTLFIWSMFMAGICDKLLRFYVKAFFKQGLVTLCWSLLITLLRIVCSSSSESSID